MQNSVEIVSQGNIACAQIPKAPEGCTTVNITCKEGDSSRHEKPTSDVLQSFFCTGSLYYSLTPLLGYWLCAFLLISYKKQVQNTTPSSPQHVPSLYRETRGSKGLNIPLADPGVRLDCESFLLPSFCILEKSLAGSLSFLIYFLTVISASHILRFFIIANTFHSYILELINGCTICLHLSEGNNCAILRSSCALLTLIHWL